MGEKSGKGLDESRLTSLLLALLLSMLLLLLLLASLLFVVFTSPCDSNRGDCDLVLARVILVGEGLLSLLLFVP